MTTFVPMKIGVALDKWLDYYLDSRRWVMEQKMDGARAVALWEPQKGVTWLQSSGRPLKFAAAALHLPKLTSEVNEMVRDYGYFWPIAFDGELMPGTGEFRIFDLVELRRESKGYQYRREVLSDFFRHRTSGSPALSIVPFHFTPEAKRAGYERVKEGGGEGVIFKHLSGQYLQGVRSKTALKMKFVKTADVVVMDVERGRNDAGRETGYISFGVYNEDGTLHPLGRCSAIGKPHVEPGDVIEVAYLYRAPETGGLVQPRMMRVRRDREPRSCEFDQFPTYTRANLLA